jgi:predicted ATPase
LPAETELPEASVLDGLGALIDQSLVWQRDGGEAGGVSRFGMLHVIREYALEQLAASGEAANLAQAHAAYYVALAERDWAADTVSEDAAVSLAYVERLEEDLDNLRAALAWLRTRAEAALQRRNRRPLKAAQASGQHGGEAPAVQGLRLAGAMALHVRWVTARPSASR